MWPQCWPLLGGTTINTFKSNVVNRLLSCFVLLYKMAHLVKRNADYSDFSAKFHFYQNNDFLFVFRVFHDDWQSKQKQSTQNHLDDGIYYLLWRSRVQGKTSYLKNATDFKMFLSCKVVENQWKCLIFQNYERSE